MYYTYNLQMFFAMWMHDNISGEKWLEFYEHDEFSSMNWERCGIIKLSDYLECRWCVKEGMFWTDISWFNTVMFICINIESWICTYTDYVFWCAQSWIWPAVNWRSMIRNVIMFIFLFRMLCDGSLWLNVIQEFT